MADEPRTSIDEIADRIKVFKPKPDSEMTPKELADKERFFADVNAAVANDEKKREQTRADAERDRILALEEADSTVRALKAAQGPVTREEIIALAKRVVHLEDSLRELGGRTSLRDMVFKVG